MLRFLIRLLILILVVIALAIGWFRMSATAREDNKADQLVPAGGRFVETVHGRLHIIEEGPEDGQPILLIHGSVGWAGLWADTLSFLADNGFRAIAVDLPPMGLSDRDTRTDYSRQAQGLRLLALVETEGIEPIVVAHSFGAGAAFEAMLVDPENFNGAVIVAGALSLGKDGAGMSVPWYIANTRMAEAVVASTITNPRAIKWLFQRFVHRKESITDRMVGILEYPFRRRGTTETLARWMPSFILPPTGAASSDPANYADLDLPVTLIWGREDTVTPPLQANALATALGNAPVFWLEGTGHIPQIEAPDAFHTLLLNALAVTAAGG